jgi:hypothetical protein
MIYYAQWPIARKQIMCHGPLRKITLKVAYLDQFKIIFEPALGNDSGDLESSIYEKTRSRKSRVTVSVKPHGEDPVLYYVF